MLFFTAGPDFNGKSLCSVTSSPARLCNDTYAAFKRGKVVRGILCPSTTNSFRQPTLEKSYLTYTHRQRQKSLIIVNVVDLVVKVVLAVINVWWRKADDVSTQCCSHHHIEEIKHEPVQA